MEIPSFQAFYPVILKNIDDAKNARQLLEIAAREFPLTPEMLEARYKEGGVLIAKNRLNWALSYLKAAGVLNQPVRGFFQINARGQEFRKQHPASFTNRDLKVFPEFVEFLRRNKKGASSGEGDSSPAQSQEESGTTADAQHTPNEIFEQVHQELQANLKQQLLEEILAQPPEFLESLIIKLLDKMGYGNERTFKKVKGKSGDRGIDGVLHKDPLGLDIIYIQAKRYDEGVIPEKEIQAFLGAFSGSAAAQGVFVSTSRFSKNALDFAQKNQGKVILIDGDQLASYMIEYELGVREPKKYTLYEVDKEFFED